MLDVEFRPRALDDFDDLLTFSADRFGTLVAAQYGSAIQSVIANLRGRPSLGRHADDVSPGLRRASSGSHAIYFRVREDRLTIVRVLHKAMLPVLHISESD